MTAYFKRVNFGNSPTPDASLLRQAQNARPNKYNTTCAALGGIFCP
jgi:hypothetical protein